MDGFNASDPSVIAHLARAVRDVVGEDWLGGPGLTRLLAAPRGSHLGAGQELVATLNEFPAMLQRLASQPERNDVQRLLQLVMVGYVLNSVRGIEGVEQKLNDLKDLTKAGQFRHFSNTLFECELAVYVRDQMRPAGVRFVRSAHPDVFVTFTSLAGSLEIPFECKRIEPLDPIGQQQDDLLGAIDRLFVTEPIEPAKVNIWLHRRVKSDDAQAIYESIVRLTKRASPGTWVTEAPNGGAFQVSVALLNPDFVTETITIDDIPADGPLAVRALTIYQGTDHDPRRIRWVVRVRSDVLPDRIGGFERNLNYAVRQLTKSVGGGQTGAAAIRIRPPRGPGDLYEADGIVRRVLREGKLDHVGFVMLLWNAGEQVEGEKQVNPDGTWQREVTIGYNLSSYIITNPASPVRFDSLDSREARFGAGTLKTIRDPTTGELLNAAGHPVTVLTEGRPAALAEAEERQGQVSIYLRLTKPYSKEATGRIEVPVRAGRRTFVGWLDGKIELRIAELFEDRVVRVATLDLRAWLGQPDLLFWIEWQNDSCRLGSPLPDGAPTWVQFTSVRAVFT